MVMTTNVQVWKLEPQVNVGVVTLSLHVRTVLFLSATSDHHKLFTKPSG